MNDAYFLLSLQIQKYQFHNLAIYVMVLELEAEATVVLVMECS